MCIRTRYDLESDSVPLNPEECVKDQSVQVGLMWRNKASGVLLTNDLEQTLFCVSDCVCVCVCLWFFFFPSTPQCRSSGGRRSDFKMSRKAHEQLEGTRWGGWGEGGGCILFSSTMCLLINTQGQHERSLGRRAASANTSPARAKPSLAAAIRSDSSRKYREFSKTSL